MAWAKRYFKGKDTVWVLVDDQGEPTVTDGRVSMRYSEHENAKVYSASAQNVGDEPADKKPRKTKSSAPKAATVDFDELVWQSPVGDAQFNTELPDELLSHPAPETDKWEFYTDGACSGNPGPCGWGWLLRHGDTYVEANQNIGFGTNNIAEMMAILTALQYATENGAESVVIHTDSNLSIGLLTKGWKAKKNTALVAATRKEVAAFASPPKFVKVKGHSGHPLNDRADLMATSSIKTS